MSKPTGPTRLCGPLLTLLALLTLVGPASSPAEAAPAKAPPPKPAELLLPEQKVAQNGVLEVELNLEYARQVINGKTVVMRSYNGKLVGPTLRVHPGDLIRVKLHNNLPANPDPADPAQLDGNFNTTNFHTHGLHVSPAGNSDNVLMTIGPGESFQYEILVPKDHPPGTHWYHSHVHGSTALQVASGVSGMLIVEGGLDDVPALKDIKEQQFVLQQFSYSECGPGTVTTGGVASCGTTAPPAPATGWETCTDYLKSIGITELPKGQALPADTQCLENFNVSFGPGQFARLGNAGAINGQTAPTIHIKAGELQRWRLVHAALHESIDLKLVPASPTFTRLVEASATNAKIAAALTKLAESPPTPFRIVAYDGIATGRMTEVSSYEMEPGYRVDLLAQFKLPGSFELIDGTASGTTSLLGLPEEPHVLAHVIVDPGAGVAPLPTAEELAKLPPYKHIEDSEISACRPTYLNVDVTTGPFFNVNGEEYSSTQDPWQMVLGTAEEWSVGTAATGGHPFHIHVNPFEVNMTEGGATYPVWKDTYQVKAAESPVKLRTRYEDYIGGYVMHCHILDHEDQGMMHAVDVVMPGDFDASVPQNRCTDGTGRPGAGNLCSALTFDQKTGVCTPK